jgi:hypothetical protein
MITKRRFFGAVLGIAAVLPVGRIIFLKNLDNPLPQVSSPEFVFVDAWVLDKQDISTVKSDDI